MTKLEIDVDDNTGRVARINGELPDPVQRLYDEAYGKGAEKAAREAKGQIESGIKAELEKLKAGNGATDVLTQEKIKSLETELSRHREADALRESCHADALKEVESRFERDKSEVVNKLTAAEQAIQARTERIRQYATDRIGTEALKAGAREESVDELQAILGRRVALDDNLEPFVTDPTDPSKPAMEDVTDPKTQKVDRKPVTIQSLVAAYLAEKPHHRSTGHGRSMAARGGQSLNGQVRDSHADDLASNPTPKGIGTSLADKLARAQRGA